MLPLNFDLKKYNYELYEWYSPTYVLRFFNTLCGKYPGNTEHFLFKKAVEAMHGALAILGSRSLDEKNAYIMQMNRQSRRPDIIAAQRIVSNREATIKVMPLEITAMEQHTLHLDIARFLLKKLQKSYPKETIFICMINKKLSYNIHDIANKIKIAKKENSIYIVGKIQGSPSLFSIATPQPKIAKTTFNIVDNSKSYPYRDRVTLIEDKMNKDLGWTSYQAKQINIFEFFMLNEARIKKVFGEGKLGDFF